MSMVSNKQSTYVIGGITADEASLIATALDYYTNNVMKVQDDTYDDLIVKFDSIALELEEPEYDPYGEDYVDNNETPTLENKYSVENNVITVKF